MTCGLANQGALQRLTAHGILNDQEQLPGLGGDLWGNLGGGGQNGITVTGCRQTGNSFLPSFLPLIGWDIPRHNPLALTLAVMVHVDK